MKNIVINLIKKGRTISKKSLKDFKGYLYFLENVLTENDMGQVVKNDNPFWSVENTKKRVELIRDLRNVTKKTVMDSAYYRILVRFTHGDRYGIV